MLFNLLPEVFGVVLLIDVIRSYRQRRAAITQPCPPTPRPITYPPVSVIRAIRGLDVGARENISAALNNGYPGEVETIFVFDDESEPALPLVRQAIDAHRAAQNKGTASVLIAGPPPPGYTGKLNAMIAGAQVAKGELIAFADSDIRPDQDTLRILVETILNREDAASSFAPIVVATPAHTAGDVGYALMINSLYGSMAATKAVQNHGEMPFIMGEFMVIRRDPLKAIGGLHAAAGQLVDDMYIGAKLSAAGYPNIMIGHRVPIIQERMSIREFLKTYRLWITFSRTGLPVWSFKIPAALPVIEFWLGTIACIAAFWTGNDLAGVLAGSASVLVGVSLTSWHRVIGGVPLPKRYFWVPYTLLLSGPFVLVDSILRRRVAWRGRTYGLNGKGQLENNRKE